jgi:hypothetical protein
VGGGVVGGRLAAMLQTGKGIGGGEGGEAAKQGRMVGISAAETVVAGCWAVGQLLWPWGGGRVGAMGEVGSASPTCRLRRARRR